MFHRRAVASAVTFVALTAASFAPASASEAACPGNPDALGTSRTLVIDPSEHRRLGIMQYGETLPLADREVVITFDDGPLPPYTSKVLDILKAECVKVTYFMVGRMARSFPDQVRRTKAEGHTIGTHSQNHPLRFHKMPIPAYEQEIDDGIASTAAALGGREHVAPFFRVPGLLRRDDVERSLAERGLMTWSADFPADDWMHISADEVKKRALQRIEARGRGMLLLHDIQPATVLALPGLLKELKARGYRVVHVVPAASDLPRTATRPEEWSRHAAGGASPAGRIGWSKPAMTIEMLLAEPVLPTPDPTSVAAIESLGARALRPRKVRSASARGGDIPLPPEPTWPRSGPVDDVEQSAARADRMVLPVPNFEGMETNAPQIDRRPAGASPFQPRDRSANAATRGSPREPAVTGPIPKPALTASATPTPARDVSMPGATPPAPPSQGILRWPGRWPFTP